MTLSIAIILLALLVSALISGSEAAFIAVNKMRMRHMAQEGQRRAATVLDVVEHHERFFGAILLSNNVANILLATVTTSVAIAIWGNTGGIVALATLVMTVVVVVFAEITPKTVATIASDRWTMIAARPVYALMVVSAPIVFVLSAIPRLIVHLLGGREALTPPTVTEGELRMMIDVGEEEGTVESSQGEMLENIFRFGETEVREVMTPRTEIVWVESGTTLKDFLALYRKNPHTRFPVFDDDYDDVVGILSIKDVLQSISDRTMNMDQPVTRLMRSPLFVPETKRLDDLFTMMQQAGHKMVLVVDEFGGIAGLATLSWVLEQIVGRTGEEGSRPKERFMLVDENTYDVDGGMTIDEANDRLNLGLPEGDYETVAGFLLEQAQRIPVVGDRFRHGDLRLQVTHMDGNRVTRLRVRRRPQVMEQAGVRDARGGQT